MLIEALIRAFSIQRLPTLLNEYEVLEVEHEEVFEEHRSSEDGGGEPEPAAIAQPDEGDQRDREGDRHHPVAEKPQAHNRHDPTPANGAAPAPSSPSLY